MTFRSIVCVFALTALSFSGLNSTAQSDPPPPEPESIQIKLVTLSDILGRAHYIQVLCNGRSDQFWRDQMSELLAHEAPKDGPLRRQLIEQFNTAYSDQESALTQCNAAARSEFSKLADKGRALSESINSLISNPD